MNERLEFAVLSQRTEREKLVANRRTVWIADDSPLERDRAASMLESLYDIRLFSDGAELVEQLPLGPQPDLLLVDWVMPQVGGLDVIEFVRSHGSGGPGIIVVTTQGDGRNIAAALAAGADDFLYKPFTDVELGARVARLLRAGRASARLVNRAEAAEHQRDEAEKGRAASDELARLAELFMGIVGHDLRSPLSAISMAAAITSRPDISQERRHAAGVRIQRSVVRMSEMIGQLLDLTRARAQGGIRVAPRRCNAALVCENVVAEMREAQPERVIELVRTGDTVTMLDPSRLSQVIANLIGNALQHGADNTPIQVSVDGTSDSVTIGVQNQGAPIPPSMVESIFDPYRRVSNRPASATDGVGLGLYISKELMAAHGGTIDVRSDEGGTLFVARLPRV